MLVKFRELELKTLLKICKMQIIRCNIDLKVEDSLMRVYIAFPKVGWAMPTYILIKTGNTPLLQL
jgi:hypothetical protein